MVVFLGLGDSGAAACSGHVHPDHGYPTLDAAISGWQHMSTAWCRIDCANCGLARVANSWDDKSGRFDPRRWERRKKQHLGRHTKAPPPSSPKSPAQLSDDSRSDAQSVSSAQTGDREGEKEKSRGRISISDSNPDRSGTAEVHKKSKAKQHVLHHDATHHPAMTLAMLVSPLNGVSSQLHSRQPAWPLLGRRPGAAIPPASCPLAYGLVARRQSSQQPGPSAARSHQSPGAVQLLRPVDVFHPAALDLCEFPPVSSDERRARLYTSQLSRS
jgi:hypothetical protein